MTTIICFLFNVLALVVVKRAIAYPTMAGGCDGGVAAVGGPHLIGAVNGSLADGNYSLFINNNVIDPTLSLTNFMSGKKYLISVRSSSSTTFRGALIRAEMDASSDFTLEPETNGQLASVCSAPILGVCHTNNKNKTELGAKFSTNSTGTLFLDVTVVKSNNAVDGSRYYYTRFTLTGATSFIPSTPTAPTAPPVTAPTAPTAPVTSPTAPTAPVTAPTAPTAATKPTAPNTSGIAGEKSAIGTVVVGVGLAAFLL